MHNYNYQQPAATNCQTNISFGGWVPNEVALLGGNYNKQKTTRATSSKIQTNWQFVSQVLYSKTPRPIFFAMSFPTDLNHVN